MKILEYQHWHILILAAMLFALHFITKTDAAFFEGELYGISTYHWYVLAVLSPILHQFYVLVTWRSELYYQSMSNFFGENGFKIFKIGFALLILSRPVTILFLSFSNAMTADIAPTLSYVLSGILLIPAVYLFYSVRKYFGMDRAFGIDHFEPEKFKNAPMIDQGIFKYTSNGMYIYGFFILWVPAIFLQSKAALLVALFNHIYIWVHYYFTELPDMKVIYSDEK